MRLFIAVDIDEEAERQVRELQEALRVWGGPVRWTRPDTWHLTIKFLGETVREKLKDIERLCHEAAAKHGPFHLELSGASCFPDIRRPRILFVDLKDSEPLQALVRDIERAMASLGFEKENRPFRPHITIGRNKEAKPVTRLAEMLAETGRKADHVFEARQFHLYESTLMSDGPRYAKLRSFELSRQ